MAGEVRFQVPPNQYDQAYFSRFIRDLTNAIGASTNNVPPNLISLPTSAVGLPVGALYSDNGIIKVVLPGPQAVNISGVPINMTTFVGVITGTGVITPPPPPPPANSFFVSPSGNDSNTGVDSAHPFLTLERAQTAMRNSTTKLTTLMIGTYNRTVPLTLNSLDAGTTWQFDPNSGVNTAVLDGGGNTQSAIQVPSGQGALNIVINGIKMQHFSTFCVLVNNGSGHITVQNCDVGFSGLSGSGVGASSLIVCADHMLVSHNYVHDCPSAGITFWAFNAGDSCDGTVIDSNVVLRCCTALSDDGAIYGNMRNANVNGGIVSITNNYVKDYGGTSGQVHAIYLDDDASNCIITGNILGPPNPSSTDRPSVIINNGGAANTYSNNIIDLSSSIVASSVNGPSGSGGSLSFPATSPVIISHNIVIANYSGACQVVSYDESGHIYDQNPATTSAWLQIPGPNTYHNYGGGAEDTQGNIISDGNPIHVDPQLSGWTYTLAAGSPVFNSPMNFAPIVGGWGPPGFVIPHTGVQPSCIATPVNAFFVSPTGNDNNVGTSVSPFQTLARAQTAMQQSGTIKTTVVKAGTYAMSSTLNLGPSDNNTAWQYDQTSGPNTAILDGGGGLGTIISIAPGSSGITINGLKIQRFNDFGIHVQPQGATSNAITVENCEVANGGHTGSTSGGITIENTTNALVSNNYVHDMVNGSIEFYAFNAGETLLGSVCQNNVILNACTGESDMGAIYTEMLTFANSSLVIKNNFIRDYGHAGGFGAIGIYLDEGASNVTVTGNIIGPPKEGTVPFQNDSGAAFTNAGHDNKFTGNIVDLGDSGRVFCSLNFGYTQYGEQNTVYSGNVIVSSFTGTQQQTNMSGEVGNAYFQNIPPASNYTIQNNIYFNYAGTGAIFTTGSMANDTNPINVNPQLSGWTYVLANTSPAFSPPVNFPPIVGGWGPPGFVIPQTGTAPSSPH